MKIVINKCYGGFGVSKDFCKDYNIPVKEGGYSFRPKEEISRTDPRLIEYIEKYGSEKASGWCASLCVEEIPKGTAYRIREYDGYESIEYCDEVDWEIAT